MNIEGSSVIKINKIISKYLEKNLMVPPQVYDFLRAIKVDLDDPEGGEKDYNIYTRKAKGKKFYNPSIAVSEEMFNAIKIVLRNHYHSVCMEERTIKFFPNTRELRIWGFSMYIKKDSPRYDLCKYMFEKKRYPRGWQFKDLAIAIGENLQANDLDDLKDKVRGKVRYLNQDVKDAIGLENFIIEESGKFVINPINIPKLQ